MAKRGSCGHAHIDLAQDLKAGKREYARANHAPKRAMGVYRDLHVGTRTINPGQCSSTH